MIFCENLNNRQVLGDLRDELTFREADRARQLLREVEAVLAGVVAVPKKAPKPDSPENQIPHLDA